MDKKHALDSLSALGQETRLDVFRLLVVAGNNGLLAGEISERLNVRQNTLSSNLSILLHTGIIKNLREGRAIRYFANMETMGELLTFLLEDCCGGKSAQCQPFIRKIACQ